MDKPKAEMYVNVKVQYSGSEQEGIYYIPDMEFLVKLLEGVEVVNKEVVIKNMKRLIDTLETQLALS